MKHVLTMLAILISNISYAQNTSISGRIVDETDTSALIGVSVSLASVSDTSLKTGAATDEDGFFIFNDVAPGQYRLRATYIGFNTLERTITATAGQPIDMGTIGLPIASTTLENVIVYGKQIVAQQLGDTTQFNAGSFKTNPDANAEDLVTKMPGVTSENGTLKVNGEDVKRILVDGKPFFGDDPNAAVKNLPAEVIDKIQVFDRLSDQSQFTGFDDGNTEKTINIITKGGVDAAQFGKVYAGYGTDNRYIAGGNLNFFNGDRRISIIGLSNNINQQNFSSEDIMGVVGTSGENRGGRGRSGGAGSRGGSSGGPSRGSGGTRGGGGSSASNFLVGQQGGITTTNSIGLNYSDNWGKKMKVSGSYFFNRTNNDNSTTLRRQYIPTETGLLYNENSTSNTINQNHRFNMRLEYDIDSNNSLVVTPRVSFQNSEYARQLMGTSNIAERLDGRTTNTNAAQNTGYNISNNILYRHKFAKRGRTVSLNLGTQLNDRAGDGTLYSLNEFVGSDTSLLDQHYDINSDGYTISGSINYTEPLGQKSQLMANYSPSVSSNKSDKQTFNRVPSNGYSELDTLLSNKFDNTYTTQRGGLTYRFNDPKYSMMFGVNAQRATLESQQEFPYPFTLDKSFNSLLPNAMFNYKFSRTKNLRIMYRTSTDAPNISQLQNVIDNTNPLILRTGNPDLLQDYEHTLTFRYGATNTATSHSFFAMLYGNVVNDYIGNATYIPTQDTLIDGIFVNRGSQLNRPVNIDGYLSARSFLTYGLPITKLKSNLNLNGGLSYTHAPSIINNTTNFANNYNFNAGFTLGSNISENVDFTLSYSGNYSIVRNTLQDQLDNNYYFHNASARFNWIFLKNFVFNTNLNQIFNTGVTQDFDPQSFLLWNAGLGYKFLKDRSLDVRLNVYDILNQNRSISNSVTDTYIEDSQTDVLQRYLMLNVTYTLRNFNSGAKNNQAQE